MTKKQLLSICLVTLGLSLTSCGDKSEPILYCRDSNIDGSCDICGKSWLNSTKELFFNTFGEVLPYFETTQEFTETPYNYIEAIIDGDARNAIKYTCLSTGKYTVEDADYLRSPALLFYKTCDGDPLKTIRLYVIYNQATDKTYADADLILTEMDFFPRDLVEEYLDDEPLCDIVVPDDGTIFSYEENEYCCSVYSNCDGYAFLQKLINAEYIIDYSMMEYYEAYYTFRAISNDRSLAMEVDISRLEGTDVTCVMRYSVSEIPTETEWPKAIQTIMVDLFGELLPFANAGFVFNEEQNRESAKYHNYMMGSSYNIDAFEYMVNAYKDRSDYSWEYSDDGNFYTFTKDCGTFFIVAVVGVYESETVITAERQIPAFKTWPGERILECFDIEISDEIPAATGSLFKLYYEEAHPNIALVTVMGTSTNLDAYLETLETANYKVQPDSISDYAATAPNRSVVIYITDYTDIIGQKEDYEPFFVVEIQAHIPSPIEDDFPLDEVNDELNDGGANYDGPVPTGTSFTVSYPYGQGVGACDVIVSIKGGDRGQFISDINLAGYTYDESYSYLNYDAYANPSKHIVIYVYTDGTNTDYDIEFGLYFSF